MKQKCLSILLFYQFRTFLSLILTCKKTSKKILNCIIFLCVMQQKSVCSRYYFREIFVLCFYLLYKIIVTPLSTELYICDRNDIYWIKICVEYFILIFISTIVCTNRGTVIVSFRQFQLSFNKKYESYLAVVRFFSFIMDKIYHHTINSKAYKGHTDVSITF